MSVAEATFLKDTLDSISQLADSGVYTEVQLRLLKEANFKRKPNDLPSGYKTRAFLPCSIGDVPGSFSLNVKYLNSNMVTAISKVTLQSTILEVKGKIFKVLSILPEHQRLVLKGRALPDNKTLEDLNIDSSAVLHLLKKAPASASTEDEKTSSAVRSALPTPTLKKIITGSAQKLVSQDSFWDGLQSHLTEVYKSETTEEDIDIMICKWRESLASLK